MAEKVIEKYKHCIVVTEDRGVYAVRAMVLSGQDIYFACRDSCVARALALDLESLENIEIKALLEPV